MGKPAPICHCETCTELRAARADRPMRLTALEQWHNFGEAQRELHEAIKESPPITWLTLWVEHRPKQAIAVASILCLGVLAIFLFVEPVHYSR